MKRLVIAIPSALIVIVVLLLVAPSFVDWSSYKTQAQEQLKKATGYDVVLEGNLALAILPSPRIMIENLVVNAPAGSKYEHLISLERLDVNISLWPLLGGDVTVDSVRLVKPQITLEVLKSGAPNWITAEVEKTLAAKKEEKKSKSAQQPSDNKLAQAVSLQKVSIQDGSFLFYDQAKGSEFAVKAIDIVLRAETLEGPYDVEGQLVYGGYTVAFDGGAGRYNADTRSIVPKIKASIAPGNIDLDYSGVLSFEEALEIQGETSVSVSNLAQTLAAFGIQKVDGLGVPLTAQGLLTASQKGFDYKNLSLKIDGAEYTGDFGATLSPLNIKANLKAAQAPALDIWLPSSLSVDMNVSSQADILAVKDSVVILDDMALVVTGSYRKAYAQKRPKAILKLSANKIDLDGLQNDLASKKPQAGQGQAGGSRAAPRGKADIQEMAGTLTLPFDLDFDVAVESVKVSGHDLSGVKAKGVLLQDALTLDNLSVGNMVGSNFALKGKIASLKALTGVDLSFNGASQNVKTLADALGVKTDALPPKLEKAEVAATFKGNAQSLAMTSNVRALNGQLITQGTLTSPLKSLKLDDLNLQVKHGNLAQVIQIFNPGFKGSASLAKPVDVYAAMSRDGDRYKFSNIKGNLAGTSLQGQLDLNMGGAKPAATGSLQFSQLTIDAPAQKTSKGGSGGGSSAKNSQKGKNGDVRWSREAIDVGWMHVANISLDIVAEGITYGKWKLLKPALKVRLNNGTLDIKQLDAGLFGGTIALNASVKSSESPRQPIHVESSSQLRNVSVEQLVQALSGNKVVKGKGFISMDADLAAAGLSPAALVYDLNGKGSMSGKDLVFEGYDLTRFAAAMSDDTKLGHNIDEIWRGTTEGGSTSFDTLDGSFAANEGVINVTKLDLDSATTFVSARGTIDLPRWWINMPAQVTMKPPYDIPPYTIPIEGPLDHPKALRDNILTDFLARKIERKLIKELGGDGGLGSLLGKVLNVPQQQQPQPQQQPGPGQVAPSSGGQQQQQPAPQPQQQEIRPEDAIRGILEGLF